MSQVFTSQLGIKIKKTNITAQKVDNTILKTYGIVIFNFLILNKDYKKRFFEKNFLFTDIKLNIVHKMLFLTLSNADLDFQTWNL